MMAVELLDAFGSDRLKVTHPDRLKVTHLVFEDGHPGQG
jgi:hypothetical protein